MKKEEIKFKNLTCCMEIANPKEKLGFGELNQIILYDNKLRRLLLEGKRERC